MGEQPTGWRIVVISIVMPIAEALIATLREMGHDAVAWLIPRRPMFKDQPPPPWGETSDKTAPQDVNLLFARDKADLAPLLRGLEPDLVITLGLPLEDPAGRARRAALRLGQPAPRAAPAPPRADPAVLGAPRGRHRVLRHLAPHGRRARHRADPRPDDRSRSSTRRRRSSRWARGWSRPSIDLLPRVFERLAAGDPGEPQATEGASWAGHASRRTTRRSTGRRRRARSTTRCAPGTSRSRHGPVDGPFAELDGKRVKVKRTSLTDPGDGSPAHETGDGQIWILETEEPAS